MLLAFESCLLLLLLLLLLSTLSCAHRECLHVLDEATQLPVIGPLSSDCHNAVTHLPYFPETASNLSFGGPDAPDHRLRLVTPAHPYLPFNDVVSGSCMLVLRFYEGRIPLSTDAIDEGELNGMLGKPLTEATVSKLWSSQREAAQLVLQNCIARGMAGIQWEPIDVPEVRFAWYAALVTQVRSDSGNTAREQRALWASRDDGPEPKRTGPFLGGVYHV